MKRFDIAVIGGGPAGYTAALKAAGYGKSAVLFEQDRTGGTCLNAGCIPTKAYLDMVKRYSRVSDNEGYIKYSELSFDIDAANKIKNQRVDKLRDGLTKYLAASGIKIINAKARILQGGVIEAGGESYEAEYIIIATGSIPSNPQIDGIEYAKSTDALTAALAASREVVIIGGGAVAIEFSQIYSSIADKVSMIFLEERILPAYEKDISQSMTVALKKRGIKIFLGSRAESARPCDGGFEVFFSSADGSRHSLFGELVINASGRRPRADSDTLDGAGIKYDARGIFVNGSFETNVRNIYAVGDAVFGNIMLAHKAVSDAQGVVEHIINGVEISKPVVPSCIYCCPEIACAGLSSEQCVAQGIPFLQGKAYLAANGKAAATGEDTGFIKVLFNAADRRLLAIHMLCENASEMIGGFAAMIGLERETILRMVFPHPTVSEAFCEAVERCAPYNKEA